MPWLPSSSSSQGDRPAPSGPPAAPRAGGSSPTWTCRPRGRRPAIELSQVTGAPSASSDRCAPPPVELGDRGRRRRPRPSTRASAPSSRASSSAAGETSTATTRRPGRDRDLTADSPTPPQPCTATHSPGRTRPCWTTARKAVANRQPRPAAVAKVEIVRDGDEVDVGRVERDDSASEPQWVNPGWVWASQTWWSPAAHWAHASAGVHERHGHPVARPASARTSGADRRDRAGQLVPGHVRQDDVGVVALPAVPVAAADAARRHPDDDAVRRRVRGRAPPAPRADRRRSRRRGRARPPACRAHPRRPGPPPPRCAGGRYPALLIPPSCASRRWRGGRRAFRALD